jgi:hypothetical protein
MSVKLVSEEELRAALRPFRVEPHAFEAAVRTRLQAAQQQRENNSLRGLSPALKSAAAFLPAQLLGSGKMAGAAAKLAPAAGWYKLLSYMAFPAISLFVLVGATIFSVARIRTLPTVKRPELDDEETQRAVIQQWWQRHRVSAWLVFAATLGLACIGATWLLFLLYLISFGLLLYVLTGFARLGLGNRQVIAQTCLAGLALLAQLAVIQPLGDHDIHFVDPGAVAGLLLVGAMMLLPFLPRKTLQQRIGGVLFAGIAVATSLWFLSPVLRPVTPSRIKQYVESFDASPYPTVRWPRWEIVARWAIDSRLDPDLTRARRLLAQELSGEQNPFILGSAFRVGLVGIDQLAQLRDYEKRRHLLLDDPYRYKEKEPILSLEQEDWVIRAAVLHRDLTAQERDFLEKRLYATLEDLSTGTRDVLQTALRATQLLNVIDRPVDRNRYRARVHDWLRTSHSRTGGGFALAGGFMKYANLPPGSMESTAHAVELMQVYGVPDGLDLNWVRSFLRPRFRVSDEPFIAAVTRDRLNHLPGVARLTWLEVLYYERSLIAALALIGLCLYATLISPRPTTLPLPQKS